MHEGRTDMALPMTEEEQALLAMSGEDGAEPRQRPVVNRAAAVVDPNDPATWGKVARNSACPCESGKKFKHCHGQLG
jgi:preprotein translocase subunit SecA